MKSLLILIASCGLSSCALYLPNAINTPHLKQKGHLDVTPSRNRFNDINLNAAYAVDDRKMIVANLSLMDRNYISWWSYGFHRHRFLDLGYGKYYFNKDRNYKSFAGGLGFGYSEFEDTGKCGSCSSIFAESNFLKTFFQYHAGGVTSNNVVKRGLVLRISHIYNYNLISSYYSTKGMKNFFFAEPALYIAAGWPKIKFYYQFGLSIHLFPGSGNNSNSTYISTVGLSLDINGR
jgi:hypothetical protein